MSETTKTETEPMPAGVKISYLRDETFPDRVLTVVRVFDKESKSAKFGWSVNVPTEWKWTDGVEIVNGKHVPCVKGIQKKGDQFARKTGRNLALRKMADETHIAYLSHDNESPLKAVLKYMITEGNRLELPQNVIAIAKQHVDQVQDHVPAVPLIKPKKSFLDRVMSFFRG